MTLNNFRTMAWLQGLQDKDTALTPELVLDQLRRITQDTLDTSDAAGRLRRSIEMRGTSRYGHRVVCRFPDRECEHGHLTAGKACVCKG